LKSRGNSSPVVSGGRVFLHVASDKGKPRGLKWFDRRDGKELWSRMVSYGQIDNSHKTNPRDGSTPVCDGKRVIVWHGSAGLYCYDYDGKELWSRDLGVIVRFKGPRLGFKLTGAGEVTKTHRLWHVERRNPQRIGTGVFVNGCVFTANLGPGTMECMDPKTGEINWQARTPGGDTWASLVYAAGHLYVTTQRGTTHILRPNPEKLDLVASNPLNETTNASPAISNGELFIRTQENLYCISTATDR